MGREGRGKGRGRNPARGRGNNKTLQQQTKQNSKSNDPSTAKFVVGTAKQASDFTKIKKYCINQFKLKYKQGIYIATALENGTDYDFQSEKPKPLVIIKENGTEDEKLIIMGMNESNKIEFQMAMTEYTEKTKPIKRIRSKPIVLYGTNAFHK